MPELPARRPRAPATCTRSTPTRQRPSCIWVNADNGSAQIQNFDAYTGGACGKGPIRVLASSIVVPRSECRPTRYASLQVTSPARGTYTGGTVTFVDGNDREIPEHRPAAARRTTAGWRSPGSRSTPRPACRSSSSRSRARQGATGSVTVVLTWTGDASATCDPSGERARLVHVAVGDSYSSGEGAPPFEDGANFPVLGSAQENTLTYGSGATSCHRSLTNYAKLASPHLDPELQPLLVDRTCSGATIDPGSGGKGAISPTSRSRRTDHQPAQALARLQARLDWTPTASSS